MASSRQYKLWIEEWGEWVLEDVAKDLTAHELIEIWIERTHGNEPAFDPEDLNVCLPGGEPIAWNAVLSATVPHMATVEIAQKAIAQPKAKPQAKAANAVHKVWLRGLDGASSLWTLSG